MTGRDIEGGKEKKEEKWQEGEREDESKPREEGKKEARNSVVKQRGDKASEEDMAAICWKIRSGRQEG